ncbi:MAG: hypothetical protein LHW61_02500, partial [Candidatus Cloacimonetes bacterium]|nr:hypothetical protein [Candidatus Cloacimonadota bacterium]
LLAWRRYDENSQIDVVLNYGKDKLSLDFLSISEIILILGDIDQTSDSIILYPESGIVYNTY